MSLDLRRLIDHYRDLTIPDLLRGRIRLSGNTVKANVDWSETCTVSNKKTTLVQEYVVELAGADKAHIPLRSLGPPALSTSSNLLSRAWNDGDERSALLTKEAAGKRTSSERTPQPQEFIRILNHRTGLSECTVDLATPDKHGKILTGEEVGLMEWSHGDGHLLYLAESKVQNLGYSDPKFDPEDEEAQAGKEFEWVDVWGEGLKNVGRVSLCVLNVASGLVSVLDGLPPAVLPVQPVWAPDDEGVVFIGFQDLPFRLGRAVCYNRRSKLYYYELAKAECVSFGEEDVSVDSVRFCPDGSMFVFLQMATGGPHIAGQKLMLCEWPSREIRTVVDLVSAPTDLNGFPGLYEGVLPQRCWLKDNTNILLTSVWRSRTEILRVNTETGSVARLTNIGKVHGCWGVVDVLDDLVLGSCSSPNRAPSLLLSRLSAAEPVWLRLAEDNSPDCLKQLSWTILGFRREADADEDPSAYVDCQYEGIAVHPTEKEGCPLLVIPHGGPHTAALACWSRLPAFFASCGYFVLLLNYRGSAGFGEDFLHALPGHIGVLDVKDCQHAVETVLRAGFKIDPSKVSVLGGSHGGFLSAHLICQFPDFYRAAVIINGVLNCAIKWSGSDIPDWTMVEGLGQEYDASKAVTPEQMRRLWEASPIRFVEQLRTPVLLAVGARDGRVPPDQANELWRIMRAKGLTSRLLVYPESGHRVLKEPETEMDLIINAFRWIQQHTFD